MPAIPWGEHSIYLAQTGAEFDLWLDLISAESGDRCSAALRWLSFSPAGFLWTLARWDSQGAAPSRLGSVLPRTWEEAAAAIASKARGEPAVAEPGTSEPSGPAIIGRVRPREGARFLEYLRDSSTTPAAEQARVAAQLLLGGLEFRGGPPAGPVRNFFQQLIRDFCFRLSPRLGGDLDAWFDARRETTTTVDPIFPESDLAAIRQAAARTDRLWRIAQAAELRTDQLHTEKLAALRQLAYGASHEINNPLANISSRAQLLLRNETDPQRRRHLASIHTQAMRAHEMISDMMLFAHPPEPQWEHVEFRGYLTERLAELRERFGDSQWEIVGCDFDSLPPTIVRIDPDLIHSLLQAVMQNALESRETGRLEIRANVADRGEVQVKLQDNGPGVSPEQQRHMFDPFFSGREAGRGLGFGLSKAWVIAQLHGGALEVVESSSAGTTMQLRLPCEKPAQGADLVFSSARG